jgi:endonuclease-8
MPEGDTLFRTAANLHTWLAGREVTAATAKVDGLPTATLVGQRVEAVEAKGKHLLIRFESGQVLHSHLRMSGSWHVYRQGERWRRPPSQARLQLTCGDRVAVCFNAPVVELLAPRAEDAHPVLTTLGPDILADELDLAEIRRRARSRPGHLPLGDLLLDQQVASGIGNIYRCEALFLEGRDPATPQSALSDPDLGALISAAAGLMRQGLGPWRPTPRWVYARSGRPCRRCGTPIRSQRQGPHARTVYWCPECQR